MTLSGTLRPTRQGWTVLQIAGLLLLVGLFKAINLLALLGFMMVAVVLVNLVLVRGQCFGLTLQRHLPRTFQVGSPVLLEDRLTGTTRRHRHDLLVVDEGPEKPVVALVPELKGQATAEVVREWEPARRGRQQLGPVWARSRYPFGMLERGLQLSPAQDVIVWPALGEIHRGKLTRQMQRQQVRDVSRQRSRPERTAQQEICGLRPYRPGDSARLIHWRTSARRGELMVREYEDIPPESLTVVFDATTRCSVYDMEQALSFTATLCWEWCRHRGERLVLGVQAQRPEVLAGTTGPELGADLLDLLAVVEEGHPGQGEDLVALLGREGVRGGGVLLVSGGTSNLADRLRRELGLSVLPMTAADLPHLDGYTGPMYLGDLES